MIGHRSSTLESRFPFAVFINNNCALRYWPEKGEAWRQSWWDEFQAWKHMHNISLTLKDDVYAVSTLPLTSEVKPGRTTWVSSTFIRGWPKDRGWTCVDSRTWKSTFSVLFPNDSTLSGKGKLQPDIFCLLITQDVYAAPRWKKNKRPFFAEVNLRTIWPVVQESLKENALKLGFHNSKKPGQS